MNVDFEKDFSETTVAQLLLQDRETKKFLIYTSPHEHEEGFHSVPTLNLTSEKHITQQIGAYLQDSHLKMESLMELATDTNIVYAVPEFDRKNTIAHSYCFLVTIQTLETAQINARKSTVSSVNLKNLHTKLLHSPYYETVLRHGIARLLTEQSINKEVDWDI